MHFHHIINAALSKDNDRPLMQKEVYPVSHQLQHYLQLFNRDIELPIAYSDLLHYQYTNAIKDENGKHTHWENVLYEPTILAAITSKLIATYQLLNQLPSADYSITAIDFCEFANSMPFRISLINNADNYSNYFYIKAADASRIYGLELEQLLSPNQTNFLYHQNTLVETHIDGVPGDEFLLAVNKLSGNEHAMIAEEFIRFNERCFVRLLGDMRSYNFVVLQNDAAASTFRIKAIDFDQQCYEGKLNLYLPQFYKENLLFVELSVAMLDKTRIEKLRQDERKKLAALYVANQQQLELLINTMLQEEISENYKVVILRKELNTYHQVDHFAHCKTMGAIVQQQIKQLLLQ
jgi:hypothetical protein